MATTTLAAVRTAAQNQGNFKTTDTRLTTTTWAEIINRALRQIALDHDWFWLLTNETLTTVPGTSTLAPAATFLRTKSITHNDVGTPLTLREISELDRITTAGRPILYTVENSTISVKPVPDAAYTLMHRFVRTEIVLAADGDSPLIPLEFSEGLILYATKLAFEFIHDTTKALEASKEYTAWLNRSSDNNARSREPFQARVRPGSLF